MRFLYRLVIIVLLSCTLAGCGYLCKFCHTNDRSAKEVKVDVYTAQAAQTSRSFINHNRYGYKLRSSVGSIAGETFVVLDSSDIDPPPVRSKPRTFINVPVPQFRRDRTKTELRTNVIPPRVRNTQQNNKRKRKVTVFFGLSSYRITGSGGKKLEVFAGQHKGKSVCVTGYTCWRGSQKYNNILASKRAQSVARRLRKKWGLSWRR